MVESLRHCIISIFPKCCWYLLLGFPGGVGHDCWHSWALSVHPALLSSLCEHERGSWLSDKMTGSSWHFDKPILASFKAVLRRKPQFQNLPRAISILAYLLAKCKDLARHVSHNRLRQPKFQLEDYIAAIAQSSAKDARWRLRPSFVATDFMMKQRVSFNSSGMQLMDTGCKM